MTLPSLTQMQVKTAVHESVLDQIQVGLPATIRLDAFQERSYRGSVHSVAVLPDQDSYMSSDTKMYETIVTIDEEVKQIKPGMTAVVEIHVDRLEDVLSVPLQAVVQVQDDTWCYVDAGGGRVERRMLTLGRTNDKFIEIREGLEEGDRVVLNPMAIVDETKARQSTISPDEGDESSGKPIPSLEGEKSSEKSAGNRPEKRSGLRSDGPAASS
jgi:multidrug efflux pump subunit AcrA (membrane-fusion protein)